ncbi:MAG TPA: hypothetical protein VGF12_07060 [Roseateles sp.]|uniref:hypothetical protein n=1 Tax=Roseateles sp. TaxID=1971397 RepID=UPI002ED7DF05
MSYSVNILAPSKVAAKKALAVEIERMTNQLSEAQGVIASQIDSLPDDDALDVSVNLGSQLHEGTAVSSLTFTANLVQRPR